MATEIRKLQIPEDWPEWVGQMEPEVLETFLEEGVLRPLEIPGCWGKRSSHRRTGAFEKFL